MRAEKSLLMVDDDPDMCEFVRDAAAPLGLLVSTHTTAASFLAALPDARADILLLDLVMPDTDGIELLSELARRGSRAKIYLMSGFTPAVREAALRLGKARGLNMCGIIPKPVRLARIREILGAAREG